MTNAQPPPLLGAGLPLPRSAELLAKLPEAGAAEGDPPKFALAAGPGLAGGSGWVVTGAALVGAGAGTDETCETCETWETCPPEPDTWDEWLTWNPTLAGAWPFTARSGNATTLAPSRFPAKSGAACAGVAPRATAVTAAASGRIGDFRTTGPYQRHP